MEEIEEMGRASWTIRTVVFAVIALGFTGNALAEPSLGQSDGMAFVKGGCFEMGDDFMAEPIDEPHASVKKPVHTVCVGDFYIGRYEVTQRQWAELMGNNPSYFKSCDECPVENVSWNDAHEFMERLGNKDGRKYRLPTEAEWEYAARSGGRMERYAGADDDASVWDYAWHDANSDGKTHPVGQKKPNGLGLYDMSGNAWEWVQDWFSGTYYKTSPKDDPKGPLSGEYRVLRGGAWACNLLSNRAASRTWTHPDDKDFSRGFRLARDK